MVENVKKPRGRPRKFDEGEAIRMATNVFWAKGFDGVTIDDLVEGMGVGRPSLYAIFGDKSTLFMRCLEAYRENLGKQAAQAVFGPADVREAIRSFLRFSVETATDPSSPVGCLMVCVAPLVEDENVRRFLTRANEETTAALAMRLKQGIDARQLSADFPCEERSRMLTDTARGLRVRARIGVPRQELLEDADRAAELFLRG
ncbi:MAG: TetR/AcrR family transcriptional regulator [Fimbriimonadaceae bacterium]